MKTELNIDFSMLTGRIHIGRSKPGGNSWIGEHKDVTEQAVHIVAEYCLNKYPGKSFILRVGDQKTGKITEYEIVVTKK